MQEENQDCQRLALNKKQTAENIRLHDNYCNIKGTQTIRKETRGRCVVIRGDSARKYSYERETLLEESCTVRILCTGICFP